MTLPMKYCLFHSKGTVSISDSMQFIEDSDLNGENPQFTLTCISTGGPATTVIWSRDSEEVSGGMTVLNDSVTARYIHTLTVTERLGGQYQCTVSNSKPSSDTASITVQGSVGSYFYNLCICKSYTLPKCCLYLILLVE